MQMNLNRITSAILASSKRIPEGGVCRRPEIILQTEMKQEKIRQMLFNWDDEFVYQGKSLFPGMMRLSSSKS